MVASVVPVLEIVTAYSIFSVVPGSAFPSPSSPIIASVFVAVITGANAGGAGAAIGPGAEIVTPCSNDEELGALVADFEADRRVARTMLAPTPAMGAVSVRYESKQAMSTRRMVVGDV